MKGKSFMRSLNEQFLILQSIGIILVVIGHKGGISLFSDWFPVYSFHMPLFIFISGYFYKKESAFDLKGFLIKKIKNLIVPYFIWNLIYGLIVFILRRMDIINFGGEINLNNLFIEPWKGGHQFSFNLAAWFVLALFIVQVIYILIRIVLGFMKIKNEYILMILFIIIGCTGVYLANIGYNKNWNLIIVRTMFLIPFYHMGYIYKDKIEKRDCLNSYIYFLLLFAIQFLLIKKYKVLTFTVVWCNDFNKFNILLPYVTSVTGIMFWLRISRILIPSLKNSKVVRYIGENTWTIMMHHIFIFFLFNLILSYTSSIIGLSGFDYEKFRRDIYYSYTPNVNQFKIFYVLLGISIPLLIKYYSNKIIFYLRYCFKNSK